MKTVKAWAVVEGLNGRMSGFWNVGMQVEFLGIAFSRKHARALASLAERPSVHTREPHSLTPKASDTAEHASKREVHAKGDDDG